MTGCQVRTAWLDRVPAAAERLHPDRIEDGVVGLAVLREVRPRVVDNVVRSKRPDELDVLGVAHGRDVGPHVSGELNGRGADGAGRSVYEDAPPPRPPQSSCQ